MKIKHFRIDDRLIHGQIVTVWIQNINCGEIVVADDLASKDTLQQSLLHMAVPKQVKLKILSVEKAVAYLNSSSDQEVFLIVRNLQTVSQLNDMGLKFERVNIGNISPCGNRKKYTKSVWLSDEDIHYITELMSKHIYFYIQVVPNEHIYEMDKILNK